MSPPTCQKCGGDIAGWLCQQCPAEFRENDDGVLIFDDGEARSAPAPEGGAVPEWVVNDIAELGVKIGNRFFWLYKGESLVYGANAEDVKDGIVQHDEGGDMHWRPVFKREFGECAHPLNRADPTRIGTVSLDDSDEWKPLHAAIATREEAPAEVGERDYPAEFEAWWATYRHRNRDVADYSVKKQIAFDAFYHAALRAQPQAREEAQPVGVVDGLIGRLNTAELDDGTPLYTHPAPDALRVAVEALEKARDALHKHYVDWGGDPEDAVALGQAWAETEQALAALQAEQGASS